MFSIPCEMYGRDRRSSFVLGCQQFMAQGLKVHSNSKEHINAVKVREVKDTPDDKTPAKNMLQRMNQAQMDRLTILFRNAHALAKHARPSRISFGCPHSIRKKV